MKDKIVIRVANDKDAEEVRSLIFNIWIGEYQFNINKEEYPDLQHIQKHYLDDGGMFLLAHSKNRLIGTIACEKLDTHTMALKRTYIAKEYRKQGVAQLLLDSLFERMVYANKHYEMSFLLGTVEDEAPAAIQFYLKNGFKHIPRSELPSNFPLFFLDDFFMRKNDWITPVLDKNTPKPSRDRKGAVR